MAARKARGLKFCPETNDLLYPRENKEARRLEYYCKNCSHVEPAEIGDYCVYMSETTTYTAADKTQVRRAACMHACMHGEHEGMGLAWGRTQRLSPHPFPIP
jgi:DNA-directed RNA polymerase subunit M/transcription elongation factor TFIIS